MELFMGEDTTLQDAILSLLEDRQGEVTLGELVQSLAPYNPMDIKRAVWPLMSDHIVELTPRRTLRATGIATRFAYAR
jgi:hypothetical protein